MLNNECATSLSFHVCAGMDEDDCVWSQVHCVHYRGQRTWSLTSWICCTNIRLARVRNWIMWMHFGTYHSPSERRWEALIQTNCAHSLGVVARMGGLARIRRARPDACFTHPTPSVGANTGSSAVRITCREQPVKLQYRCLV